MGLEAYTNRGLQVGTRLSVQFWIRQNWMMRFSGATWSMPAEIRVRGTAPPMVSGEIWQVGFIQNVIRGNASFRYESGRRVHVSNGQQLLDAMVQDQPWIGTQGGGVLPWNAFFYQGPDKPFNFNLNFNDHPSEMYFNYFGGGTNGDQLRELRDETTFRCWLAAIRASDPAGIPSSYLLLQVTNDFRLVRELRIPAGGGNAIFRYAYDEARAGTSLPLPALGVDIPAAPQINIQWGGNYW